MVVEKLYIAGEYELHLRPENEEEVSHIFDFARVGDTFVGQCIKEAAYIYPDLVLKKEHP